MTLMQVIAGRLAAVLIQASEVRAVLTAMVADENTAPPPGWDNSSVRTCAQGSDSRWLRSKCCKTDPIWCRAMTLRWSIGMVLRTRLRSVRLLFAAAAAPPRNPSATGPTPKRVLRPRRRRCRTARIDQLRSCKAAPRDTWRTVVGWRWIGWKTSWANSAIAWPRSCRGADGLRHPSLAARAIRNN